MAHRCLRDAQMGGQGAFGKNGARRIVVAQNSRSNVFVGRGGQSASASIGARHARVSTGAVRSVGASAGTGACNQHATSRSVATSTSGGASTRQRSNATGQRGWKRQPTGGRAGSGTSPVSASGNCPDPSG